MLHKTIETLKSHNISFEEINHSPTYTSEQTAHSVHISGKRITKTVLVEIDGEMAMAVLHVDEHVDLNRLKELTGAHVARLLSEREFLEIFRDCEMGALPPFGNLYDMPVFVSSSVDRDESIIFNPGSHSELVRISYNDFKRLVHPAVLDFAVHQH